MIITPFLEKKIALNIASFFQNLALIGKTDFFLFFFKLYVLNFDQKFKQNPLKWFYFGSSCVYMCIFWLLSVTYCIFIPSAILFNNLLLSYRYLIFHKKINSESLNSATSLINFVMIIVSANFCLRKWCSTFCCTYLFLSEIF